MSLDIWYEEGLKFQCTQCGKCCTGSPGYTWITEDEIAACAAYLEMTPEEFGKKYLRKVGNKWALLEMPGNYDCVFLKNKKCRIYPVRPSQCRTYPFWHQNLTSKEAWLQAASFCEGIGQGEPVPAEEIEKNIKS